VVKEMMRMYSQGPEAVSGFSEGKQKEDVPMKMKMQDCEEKEAQEDGHSVHTQSSQKVDAMVTAILNLTSPDGVSTDDSDVFSTSLEDRLSVALENLKKQEEIRSRKSVIGPGEWLDVSELA
jgi:hypothetical protein